MRTDNPRHRPNRFDKYIQIHEAYIDKYISEGFVSEETLEYIKIEQSPFEITLKGEIACNGQILITFNKTLDILSGVGKNPSVQTILYEYNVSVRSYGNVLRYDNSHGRSGHPDKHHKHEFNWKLNEKGEGKVTWIGEENWLTLGEVIEEVREWYEENRHELPTGFPKLGLRE